MAGEGEAILILICTPVAFVVLGEIVGAFLSMASWIDIERRHPND